jgi:hypothetical protein
MIKESGRRLTQVFRYDLISKSLLVVRFIEFLFFILVSYRKIILPRIYKKSTLKIKKPPIGGLCFYIQNIIYKCDGDGDDILDDPTYHKLPQELVDNIQPVLVDKQRVVWLPQQVENKLLGRVVHIQLVLED